MGTLNDQAMEKRDTIKNAGYNHVSTYECQLAKNKDFQKFAVNFTQQIVEPLSPRDFMEDGQRQPNSYKHQRKQVWPLHRFLFSLSNSPVLPKVSNRPSNKDIQP